MLGQQRSIALRTSRRSAVSVKAVVVQPKLAVAPSASSNSTVVSSWTEWQPLRELIVGRCKYWLLGDAIALKETDLASSIQVNSPA